MPTLPLHMFSDEWEDAKRLHLDRYAKSIWSVLDCAINCRHDNSFENCHKWFFGNEKKFDKPLFDEVRSWDGREYLQMIQREVASEDVNENILTAPAEKLLRFLGVVLDKYGEEYYDTKGPIYQCNRYLLNVFNYEKFTGNGFIKSDNGRVLWGTSNKKKPIWGAAELLRKTGLRYCPYCNAESVYAIPKDMAHPDGEATKSAFDHIIPHDKYPFFGISLYNLIPSCFRCNSGYKSTHNILGWLNKKGDKSVDPTSSKDIERYRLAHPYIENIHDSYHMHIRFSDDCEDYSVVSDESMLDIMCEFKDTPDVQRYKGLMEDIFRTSKTYTHLFTPEAKIFLRRLKILRPAMIKSNLWKRLGLTSRTIHTLLHGERIDEYLLPRHGKMHADLCKQFNVK